MRRRIEFKVLHKSGVGKLYWEDIAACFSAVLDDWEIIHIARILEEKYPGTWEIRWNYAGFSQGHYIPGPVMRGYYNLDR